jgi:hypothetical protein
MLQKYWWLYGSIFILNKMVLARVPVKHHAVLRRDRDTVADMILEMSFPERTDIKFGCGQKRHLDGVQLQP